MPDFDVQFPLFDIKKTLETIYLLNSWRKQMLSKQASLSVSSLRKSDDEANKCIW